MFTKNDIICFFGDSITASGLWEAEIFPRVNGAKIYNCGSPAGDTNSGLLRIYESCLIYNPTYVVVMFGANDNRPDFYGESKNISDFQYNAYCERYRKIVDIFEEFGVKVILCTCTPYDEVSDVPAENRHLDCGIDKFTEFHYALAKEKNLVLVDFHSKMNKLLREENIKVISPDRLHPSEIGYHAMAQIFMETLGIIEKSDFETLPSFAPIMKERIELEQFFGKLRFVEYEMLYPLKRENGYAKHEEITDYLKKTYDRLPDGDYGKNCIKLYFENCDKYSVFIKKYLELTNTLARSYEK